MNKSNISMPENQPGSLDLLADFARRNGIGSAEVIEHPKRASAGPVTQLAEPVAADANTEYEAVQRRIKESLGLVSTEFGEGAGSDIQAEQRTAPQPKVSEKSEAPKASGGGLHIDRESRETLKHISEDFVMLASGSKLVAYHIESGDELGKEGFIQYCDKHYGAVLVLMPPDKNGNPVESKSVSAGELWWSWKDHLRRVVRRIVMEPTSKLENGDHPEVFNRWHILKHTMAERNPKATAADIAILANHLMYLSDGDVAGVTFFLCWLAQLYQTPEIKMPTAICLYSKYGRVGKNLLQRLISKVFGQPLVANATGKQLQKNFDDAIEHIRILFINELARSEKVDGYENFKSQISEEDVQFEGKGRASKRIRNITHYVVTTNHEDALPLMENDGRIAVLRCLEPRKDDAYYKTLVDWIDGPGAPALAQILSTWVFPKDWDPYAPVPQTAATRAMQRASRDELEILLAELVEAGTDPCDKDIIIVDDLCAKLNTLYGSSMKRPANRTSAGKALQTIGAEYCEKRIEGSDGKCPNRKFYLIRNVEQWKAATPKQRGDHLNSGARLFAVQQPKTEVSDHE